MDRDDAVRGPRRARPLGLRSGFELATCHRSAVPVTVGVALVAANVTGGLAAVIGARLRENESA